MKHETIPPIAKEALGVPNLSANAVKARIMAFCDWHGVEPPKLKVRTESVYLTDDLCVSVSSGGASLEWIAYDDGKEMDGAYREAL